MDPINDPSTPSIEPAKMAAPNQGEARTEADPLVETWFKRIKAAEKHWDKLHKRMRHNRKLVRGIDDQAEATDPKYNKDRANLIQSTLTVVLSKVYAKNPEMSAQPTNKARDLRLFADTVSTVTQTMLEDAKLKKKAKATVRAAMTCSFGVVKVQYQRVTAGEQDPLIRQRINDTQDNIQRLESLMAQVEDDQQRNDSEAKKRELEEVLAGLQAQSEVVAAEGLVIDRVPSDRLLVDPAVEDIWEYETADWMVEKIPMRKSRAQGMFKDFDLKTATTYKVGDTGKDHSQPRQMYSGGQAGEADDPMVMVYEVWSKADNRVYTLVGGCNKQFARDPFTPQITGERWWSHFILPFQSVDGEFSAQSLVDVLERLQEEHNETRDKFAEVRRNIRPGFVFASDVKDKDIEKRLHPAIGEYFAVNTNGGPLKDVVQQTTQLTIDPSVYDTSPIRNDWEMVSGLQDAARSVVVQAKTATEAAISDQSLAARVSEFRDQVEDWLTEIAQYASELCLLAMTPQQVETIMGAPGPDGPTFEWPDQATPEAVFNLVQIQIRAGSTAAPNKLQMQENWNKALQLLMPMIDKIRQIDMAGADSTPERELVKETAARFDETIDVERFLPPKPAPQMPALPAGPALPNMPPALPGGPEIPTDPGMPMQGGMPLPPPSLPLQ